MGPQRSRMANECLPLQEGPVRGRFIQTESLRVPHREGPAHIKRASRARSACATAWLSCPSGANHLQAVTATPAALLATLLAALLTALQGERHGEELPEAFYESKCQASQFMFEHILPRTRAHAKSMFTPVPAIMDMKEDNFSFDY